MVPDPLPDTLAVLLGVWVDVGVPGGVTEGVCVCTGVVAKLMPFCAGSVTPRNTVPVAAVAIVVAVKYVVS